jgi:predicted ester cyclase
MSTEANKAIVRRLVEEGINQANESVFLALLSPEVVDHYTRPGLPPGREGWNRYRKQFRAAFPDGRWAIADIAGEGDLIAARASFTGTHQGELFGIPPTGRQVTVSAIYICRLAGGKIVERWANSDELGMLRQLGAIPTPEQVAA